MIQTLNPYSTTAKTAQIMSRYRPIAPKPETTTPNNPINGEIDPSSPSSSSSSMSQKIRQSPYLRNVWPHLQARPTRTRKRGRTALAPPPPAILKRQRPNFLSLSSPAKSLSLQSFTFPNCLPPIPPISGCSEKLGHFPPNLVTLPLLPCSSSSPILTHHPLATNSSSPPEINGDDKGIDLNTAAEIPVEEKDLLRNLQEPAVCTNVIAPQPVRPVGSSISVGRINEEDPGSARPASSQARKKREEVEDEVESEVLPAVVSDSNNKVRMANSAYKEMVGQPECPWLDSCDGGGKRICGEVMLRFSSAPARSSSKGFSCWVRIEWGREGKKRWVDAFSDVMRLSCESKDYLFAWRFHTRGGGGGGGGGTSESSSCFNI